MFAVKMNNVEAVKILLEHKADVNELYKILKQMIFFLIGFLYFLNLVFFSNFFVNKVLNIY